jgi:hypothetical protein
VKNDYEIEEEARAKIRVAEPLVNEWNLCGETDWWCYRINLTVRVGNRTGLGTFACVQVAIGVYFQSLTRASRVNQVLIRLLSILEIPECP